MANSIQKTIKEEVLKIVEQFNEEEKASFQVFFRGKFAYLSSVKKQNVDVSNIFRQRIAAKMGIPIKNMANEDAPLVETKLGRLKYNGSMDNWSFAVFRYSRENYDPDEFLFPGAEELDGTIQGALKAGLKLYP